MRDNNNPGNAGRGQLPVAVPGGQGGMLAPVPEPETHMMLLAGLALLGGMAKLGKSSGKSIRIAASAKQVPKSRPIRLG